MIQMQMKDNELKTKPGPQITRVLTELSMAANFEDARQEWVLESPIPKESEEFVKHCELCGHRNYVKNWLILNPLTQNKLKIGSECIRRFIHLNGTTNTEDSNRFFEMKEKEYEEMSYIKRLFSEVITDPVPLVGNVTLFRKRLSKIMDKREIQLEEAKDWICFEEINFVAGKKDRDYVEQTIRELFLPRTLSNEEIGKIMNVLYYPATLTVQRKSNRKVTRVV
jgi:hypothetical protein